MKLGLLISLRSMDEADARFEQAQNAGFTLCQLNLHGPCAGRADLARLAEQMLEKQIRPLAIGCYVNPMRPDEAGPLGATRDDLSALLQHIDLLGARKVVCFSGSFADTLYDPHPDNSSRLALERLSGFISDIVENTRARNYQIVLEPWYGHVLSSEDRIIEFHSMLEPAMREHVRYVLDAAALLTPERYPDRDSMVSRICRSIGQAAGVVHLRDCVMPPDGEPGLPGPGQGALDYGSYVLELRKNVPSDTPAIVRNVPPDEYIEVRDYLQSLSIPWALA
ncbi:MAG: sugar phosphate isomerase/epimerase [Chthonomonadales bacterium]|nr:sugar phosphate isomerase/epimerase [Chthonomonadales bacterium]